MVWDGMPEWDWMPDGMGRNALCEGTCGPMVWDEMPCAKGLGSIFFVFELRQLNSSEVTSQKKRVVAM